jgi:hypothetical protein
VGIASVAVLAVVAIAVGVLATRGGSDEPDISGVRRFENLSREHVSGSVTYEQTPPVGGSHNSVWQNCGFYADPVATESAVHSLEHGAVWITYRPGLAEAQLETLRAIARANDKVLVSPYDGLPAAVVASSWGRQLRLTAASDARLPRLVESYQDASEAPERGGPCAGGVGSPET